MPQYAGFIIVEPLYATAGHGGGVVTNLGQPQLSNNWFWQR